MLQIKAPGVGGPGCPDIAYQSDLYILKGDPLGLSVLQPADIYPPCAPVGEYYSPSFCWHGFRYMEITLHGATLLSDITAFGLNSDVDAVLSISFSEPLFSQIEDMVVNTHL